MSEWRSSRRKPLRIDDSDDESRDVVREKKIARRRLLRLIRGTDNIDHGIESQVEKLKNIISEFPELVQEEDSQDRLPLHIAADIQAPHELVKILVEAHPEGILNKFRTRATVLNMYKGGDSQMIDWLLNHAMECLRLSNDRRTVIDFFVSHVRHEAVVARLVQDFPDFVRREEAFSYNFWSDDRRMLPLHYASYRKVKARGLRPLAIIAEELLCAWPVSKDLMILKSFSSFPAAHKPLVFWMMKARQPCTFIVQGAPSVQRFVLMSFEHYFKRILLAFNNWAVALLHCTGHVVVGVHTIKIFQSFVS